jgi:hypothetical protein
MGNGLHLRVTRNAAPNKKTTTMKTIMKTHSKKTSVFLTFLTAVMISFSPSAEAAGQKVAIILQENQGRVDVLDQLNLNPADKAAASAFIDGLAENFESLKTALQLERYDKIHNLTDTDCTRAKLLARLKSETVANNTIDLFIYGHGRTDVLELHSGPNLTGKKVGRTGTVIDPGNIETMLTEAGLPRFNLRLVYSATALGAA